MMRTLLIIFLAATMFSPAAAVPGLQENLFFLHNSTGRNLIAQGLVRDFIATRNNEADSHYVFWDHDYNEIGLKDPQGDNTGRSYNIPDNNTAPDGLHKLWTTSNSARDSILTNHQVVAFKSCFPASDIGSEAELAQYKTWYLEMRTFFDTQPNTTFIVMSTPPLHRLATSVETADRARAFASWLSSEEYLSGHANLVCFNLFDQWAQPNDGSATRNMLRYDFELNHSSSNSHPNALANQTVGPIFADFLMQSARVPVENPSLDHIKTLFR